MTTHQNERNEALLYSGLALGLIAGAALATYLWKQRADGLALLNTSPLERAEQLIESCENKLESIEQAITDLRAKK
jgi:hypothetical protein